MASLMNLLNAMREAGDDLGETLPADGDDLVPLGVVHHLGVAARPLDEAVELIPDKFSLRMTRAEIMRLAGQEERLKREIGKRWSM